MTIHKSWDKHIPDWSDAYYTTKKNHDLNFNGLKTKQFNVP